MLLRRQTAASGFGGKRILYARLQERKISMVNICTGTRAWQLRQLSFEFFRDRAVILYTKEQNTQIAKGAEQEKLEVNHNNGSILFALLAPRGMAAESISKSRSIETTGIEINCPSLSIPLSGSLPKLKKYIELSGSLASFYRARVMGGRERVHIWMREENYRAVPRAHRAIARCVNWQIDNRGNEKFQRRRHVIAIVSLPLLLFSFSFFVRFLFFPLSLLPDLVRLVRPPG